MPTTTIDVTGSGASSHTGTNSSAPVVWGVLDNDNIADAVEIEVTVDDLGTGYSDPIDFTTIGATRESAETTALGGTQASGGADQGTIWYHLTNPGFDLTGKEVTIKSSVPLGIDVFSISGSGLGSDFAGLVRAAASLEPVVTFDATNSARLPDHGYTVTPTGEASVNFRIKEITEYYIRVHNFGYYSEPLSGQLQWKVTNPVLPMSIDPKVLLSVPNVINVTILGGSPNSVVDFQLDGEPITARGFLDTDGDQFKFPVPIPHLSSGTHVLLATDRVSGIDSDTLGTFTVSDQFAYFDDPTPPGFSLPDSPTPEPGGFYRFHLFDPVSDTNYTFPRNPNTVSTMASKRVVTSSRTTSPVGTSLLWEGGKRGREVTLNGNTFTLSELETLRSWCAKPYRVFMSDDIGRQWVVMLRSIKATPVRDLERPENHSYALTLLLLGRVADLDIPDSGYSDPHVYPAETLYPFDPEP